MVQASAAFVAITGGFLVTRLISISSEISEFKTKISELTLLRTSLDRNLLETRVERVTGDEQKFFDHWVGTKDVEKENFTAQELIDGYSRSYGEPEELRRVAEKIVSEYRAARLVLKRSLGPSEIPNDSDAWIEEKPFDIDEFNLPIIRHVVRVEGETRRKNLPRLGPDLSKIFGPDLSKLMGGSSSFAGMASLFDGHIEIIGREKGLLEEISTLNEQITFNRQEIKKRVAPGHFRFLIGLLSYMSVVGILLPAVAMASDPIPDSSLFKFGLIGLLGAGIIAFCIYLMAIVRSYVKEGNPGGMNL